MPIHDFRGGRVSPPLEATRSDAFAGVPARWRRVIEG